MEKKVFDILPPQSRERQQEVKRPEPVVKKEVSKEKPVYQQGPVQEKSGSKFPKVLAVFVVLLIIFVLASQFVFNRAEISILPKIETKNLVENITVSTAKKSVDLASLAIPGQVLQEEKTASKEFSATGKTMDGKKAEGIIRVYNNYSTAAQVLAKTTRFISSGGKLFRTTEKVTVPGGSYDSKGKFQAGYIDVNVAADQAGEDYNIGPSTFSIPGFAGTAKYTAFYGKSTDNMTGGALGEVAEIQKEDLDNAKKELAAKTLEEIKSSLQGKFSSDYILMEGAIVQNILSASSSLPAGTKAENFTYYITMSVKVLVFSLNDLKNLSEEIVSSEIDAQKKIKDNGLDMVYKFYSLDSDSGKMVLSVNLAAKIYSAIDENVFVENLAGKNLEEAKQSIGAESEISKVQIKSWPFWQDSLPEDINKVKVRVILD